LHNRRGRKTGKVPKIYTVVTLFNSIIGIFAPITGFFIGKFGLVVSMRALYAAGALSMTAMFIIRNVLLTETRAGSRLMAAHGGSTLLESFRGHLKLLSRLYENKKFLLLSLVFIATNFITTLNVFQVIFLTERLRFSPGAISLVPFMVAVSNLGAFLAISPRLAKKSSESVLAVFIACNFVASVLFMAIPEKSLAVMLAVMAFNGISNFLMSAYRESVFMNSQGGA
jgi:Na+/melibiose symporter-like transporter